MECLTGFRDWIFVYFFNTFQNHSAFHIHFNIQLWTIKWYLYRSNYNMFVCRYKFLLTTLQYCFHYTAWYRQKARIYFLLLFPRPLLISSFCIILHNAQMKRCDLIKKLGKRINRNYWNVKERDVNTSRTYVYAF